MAVNGTVKGGVVVLDSPGQLPEGTRVKVEVAPIHDAPGEWVKHFEGCVADMPEDASVNYHAHLYGAKKR